MQCTAARPPPPLTLPFALWRLAGRGLLALAAGFSVPPAWAEIDLAAWRRDASAARLLAENDLPHAMAEARRLEAALPADAPAADRARVLNLLSRIETYQALPSEAEQHAQQAFELAAANGDKIGQAESDLNIALNSINQGKLDDLVRSTNRAVTTLENVDRPELLGEALLRATVMYRRFEQFEDSVAVAVRAMEIARRSGDPLTLAYAHQGLAISYEQSFRYDESHAHYLEMRVQAKAAKSRMLEAFAIGGISGLPAREKDYVAAERLQREGLAIFREIGAPFAQAFNRYGLASILNMQGRQEEALAELDQAQAIYERYPNRIGTWFTLNMRSQIHLALKNFAAAQADAEHSNEIAKSLGFAIYTSLSAVRLAEIAAARGDYKQAFALATEARELTSKAARERAGRRMVELTQRYETESAQRHIGELTRRNEQQTAELRQRELQQRWLWTLLAASALVLATVAFFLLRLRRSHRLLGDLNAELARSRDAVRELNTGLEQRIEARTAQLRQQARYLRTLIDMLPLWAWFKDTSNHYLVTNQAHARARGRSAEEMVGRSDQELLPPPQAEASLAEDTAVMHSRERRITEIAVADGGCDVWMESFKAPVFDDDGTLLGTVGVARDISAQKATEAAREAALDEARRLAQARSAFLAQMSHELRTPLNAILGFAQILHGHAPLDERQERCVSIIEQSGQHLLALINDILDLARVDAGKLELAPQEVHLPTLLAMVADIIRVKVDEKGLQFNISLPPELPPAVVADDMRLRQVLLNLLANAVKFTDTGLVSLRLMALADDAQVGGDADGYDNRRLLHLRFEVSDSGIGMSEQQTARLFQPFEQVSEARRRSGGSGLGLAISRELVRLMGGELRVRSQPGQGSVFWFELDLPVCAAGSSAAEGRILGYEGPRRRVLVVDDTAPMRELMVEALSEAGFEVASAENGRAGVERALTLKPDLVVMDMTMPVLGGLDAVRLMRSLPALVQQPVIMTTASERADASAACLAAGAQAFLPKPVDMAVLVRAIGELLGLTWIRASAAAPAETAATTEGADVVVALPDDEMRALLRLARFGNMREIRSRAEHLHSLDPKYAAFAARLRLLADGYQSQAILSLVESCNGG